MTFDLPFHEDMNDPSSQIYMDMAAMATNTSGQILEGTGAEVDFDSIHWTFEEGSVVATAEDVEIFNANIGEINEFLEEFDTSLIPALLSLVVTPTGDIYVQIYMYKVFYI